MSQYTHHDFYSNFTASVKAGDLDLTTDILANELSDLVVFDIDKLITGLNKADIKTDVNDSDEAIVDSIIKNIASNNKLTSALAFVIAENNELLTTSDSNSKDNQIKRVTSISGSLNKIGKDLAKDSKSFKSSTMDQIVSKAANVKEYKRVIWEKDKEGTLTGLWVALGVFIVFLGYIYVKQKKAVSNAIPAMIMGGAIPSGPIQPITPEVQPPVITQPIAPVAAPVTNTVVAPLELKPDPLANVGK